MSPCGGDTLLRLATHDFEHIVHVRLHIASADAVGQKGIAAVKYLGYGVALVGVQPYLRVHPGKGDMVAVVLTGTLGVKQAVIGGAQVSATLRVFEDPVLERLVDGLRFLLGNSGMLGVEDADLFSVYICRIIPAGSTTVMYRVKAYDAEGLYSSYRNSAQVSMFNNNAPDAPGGITVPENALGGESLTVTWSAASDPDDNLTGYELERQVDGGEWTQVYKGAETSYIC